jgi:hypothetical protein
MCFFIMFFDVFCTELDFKFSASSVKTRLQTPLKIVCLFECALKRVSTDAAPARGAAGVASVGWGGRSVTNPAIIGEKGLQMGSFMYGPLKMAALSRIRHFVFKICETNPATSKKPRQTEPWPGICYFGADAARVVWMEDKDGKSSDTIYDGVDQGPLYSRAALDTDLAAADLVIAAIRSPEVIMSPLDTELELNDALKHVRASIHLRTEPPQDWLSWLVRRLEEVPAPALLQQNSRGKLKLKKRGVAKRVKCTCSRHDFAKLQFRGLKETEVTLLWRNHNTKYH